MGFHLLGDDVAAGDLGLLFLSVTGQSNDFHAVAQGGLNRVQHVRRRHEHDIRKIERHGEIIVAEREILLRVEDFKQRR